MESRLVSLNASDIPSFITAVLDKIKRGGYKAWLVGGCVRDLMLRRTPKDFDIATNALPTQLCALFPNQNRIAGKAFIVVVVRTSAGVGVDIATLRRPTTLGGDRNVYGSSIEEDYLRRDFTINAFYYDVDTGYVSGPSKGFSDIELRQLRTVSDPRTTYLTDPARILRAVRFASRLDLRIPTDVSASIKLYAHLVGTLDKKQLFNELTSLWLDAKADSFYSLLNDNGLFNNLFPQYLTNLPNPFPPISTWIRGIVTRTSELAGDQERQIVFVYAALAWPFVKGFAPSVSAVGGDASLRSWLAVFKKDGHYAKTLFKFIGLPEKFRRHLAAVWRVQTRRLPRPSTTASSDDKAAYTLQQLRDELGIGLE